MSSVAFQIASDEGLPLRGVIHIPEKPNALVVVIHGFKGFKDWGFFPWLAEKLEAAGFGVCRFDMSRSGIGEVAGQFDRLDLFADDTYSIERADLLRVVQHVAAMSRFQRLPIFLLGHSRGAGVALLAASEVPRLRGLITWNGISEVVRWDGSTLAQWRRDGHVDILNSRTGQTMRMSTAVLDDIEANREWLDIGRAARQLRVPLLVIHGAADQTVPLHDGRTLAGQGADASLVVLGGATHTFGATHPLREIPRPLRLATELSTHFMALRCRATKDEG
jgi:pimeloyl-ACP methyl ester carboxylesterase